MNAWNSRKEFGLCGSNNDQSGGGGEAERFLPLRVSVVSHLHNLLQSRRGVSYEQVGPLDRRPSGALRCFELSSVHPTPAEGRGRKQCAKHNPGRNETVQQHKQIE